MVGITLVTMGQGNVKALKKTLESFKHICNEVVYGDLLIFPEDRAIVESYQKEYNLRIMPLPFNYIFQMGFSSVLNYLAANAKNDFVMYMNTSETIDEDYGIIDIINKNRDCNAFYFSHRVEKHRWFRCFNRHELQWSGVIHEEVIAIKGDARPYHKPIFMMKDEEKDMSNEFKAAVFNSIKECCYFFNYMKLVDYPALRGATNEGWVAFAKEQYKSMQERLEAKGKQYEAFKTGNFAMLINDISTSDYFKKERFISSHGMNFQGARKDIL